VPVKIRTGLTDTKQTEVLGGALKAGDKVIVEDKQVDKAKANRRRDYSDMVNIIEAKQLGKDYATAAGTFTALKSVNLSIAQGEFVAIMGPSGSGKSTFMNVLGCLDHPTRGEYWLDGQNVATLSGDALAHLRNRVIGFVFQGFNLLPRLNAMDNVALPLLYRGTNGHERKQRAEAMLEKVGLARFGERRPNELSGGQQQRVAIARALANEPRLILADEPYRQSG
jgi:ABC-type antimicrobial peptide transport system, ATPase component